MSTIRDYPLDTRQLRYMLLCYIKKGFHTAVYASDQLNNCKAKNFCIIVNSQPSFDNGEHWIAFFKSENYEYLDFFDSCGQNIYFYNLDIQNFAKSHHLPIKHLKQRIQPKNTYICGQLCFYFLVNRSRNISFEKCVAIFTTKNLIKNKLFILRKLKNIKLPDFADCESLCNLNCYYDFSSVCIQYNNSCLKQNKN